MRAGRVFTVTLGIALVGAIIGGVIGAALFAAWTSLSWVDTVDGSGGWGRIAAGAGAGAGLGAVLAPLTSWVFLRRVPLGMALLQTTVGTTAGAVIGLGLDSAGLLLRTNVPAGLVGAIAGFLAAAVRLRFAARTPTREAGTQSSRPGSES
jgi:hypothetical protein